MRKIDAARFGENFQVRRLGKADAEEILDLMRDNPQYYEHAGKECCIEEVYRDLDALPPGKSAEEKYYMGFYKLDWLLGVMDFIDGYPDEDTAYIGFFMMDGIGQHSKLATAIIEKVSIYCAELGFRRIMLAWDKDNPESGGFWKSCGFVPMREVEQSGGTLVVAEKALPSLAVPGFESFLLSEAESHPAMAARDALKMCYQAAYGAEHGISDRNAARKYLREELKKVEGDASCPLCTAISPGLFRVDLRAWKARGMKWQWLYAMFEKAEGDGDGDMESKLEAVESLAAAGRLPFTAEQWKAETAAWDGGAVSHSAAYRAAYSPAYRIVPSAYLNCFPILEKMAEHPEGCVVAIDGMSNSGKSTIGRLLADVTEAGLVRMDDLLSPAGRMQVVGKGWPGGNVNYAMFRENILPNLSSEKAFSYPYFANHSILINRKRRVRRSIYRIVEGSYSQHIVFGDYADIKVFVHCDKPTQRRRVVAREAEQMAANYFRIWIPQEDEYFAFFKLKDKADIVIKT